MGQGCQETAEAKTNFVCALDVPPFNDWLVVEPTPLKNISSSMGMMTFPIYGKIKNVPKHQLVVVMLEYRMAHDSKTPLC